MNVPLYPRGRIVCTINDIIMMTSESSWGPIKKWLFRFLAGRAISRSRGVVCISDFTRREVERVFGKDRTPIRVIHPCIGEDFFHTDIGKYRKDPIVDGEYILHVGIRVRHKNHAVLIRAWLEARTAYPALRLVVAGKRLWEDDVDRLRKEFRLAGELLEFTHATDDEVKNLYANAKAFVFPSFVEGFGIPPLEAMRMGVPVVCADIPVLREVNGDAALYADPRSPASFGEAIRNVLSDGSLREHLLSAARERFPHYTRKRMATEYLEFLREMSA